MAIQSSTFQRTFGNLNAQANSKSDNRPKAEFWLNIGYTAEVMVNEEVETRFVSLPTGIPLDTQEKLPTNSRNQVFAAFQGARNDLLDQIMDAAKHLEPGEEKIIGEAGGLQFQIRRVNGETTQVKTEENPFRRQLALA
jgi:hypothetical protein